MNGPVNPTADPHTATTGSTPDSVEHRAVEVVLPGDNRQQVVNANSSPFVWVGQLECTFAAATTAGTATLLAHDDGQSWILTCAHNFVNADLGEAISAQFTPALTRDAAGNLRQPYPPIPVGCWAVHPDYRSAPAPLPPVGDMMVADITEYLLDYAVARLDTPTNTPPSTVMHMAPDHNPPGVCTIIGYSGDLDPTASTQYTRSGPAQLDTTGDFLTYTMSTFNGDSGAAVCYPMSGTPIAAAVHVSGVQGVDGDAGLNFGPILDNDVVAALIEQCG